MAKTPISFDDVVKKFDRKLDREHLETAEKERLQVVERFPLDAWPNMPLSAYALGQGKKFEAFCWWLEFGTPHVGSIKGGSARKHIIYKQGTGEWWFDRQNFKTEEDAWTTVRSGFVAAFEKAKKGQWDSIDQLDQIGWGPALRTMTLYCYFPNELLPISSIFHIVHFLHLLGIEEASTTGYEVVRLNRLLLSTLRQKKELKGWSNKELERLLYSWADPRDQRKIVKIAPGPNAQFWKECLSGGYICLGWNEIGDLREFESKEAFQAKFNEVCSVMYKGNKSTLSKKAKELWTIIELEPGDLIVANKGTDKVLAIGTVVEPNYEFRPEKSDYRHHLHVKWDTSYEQDITPQKSWAFATCAAVPQALAAKILLKKDGPQTLVPVDSLYRETAEALTRKGQVIFYGPPGTGKTFTARRFSVWWLLKELGTDSPEILTDPVAFAQAEQKLSTAQVVRRVWWVVANPKEWSWDRLFKEKRVTYRYGRLQRNYALVRRGDLVVGYQSTPDRKLVALARVSREMFTSDEGAPVIELEPLSRINDGLTYDELIKDEMLKKSEPMRNRNQGTLFALSEDESDHLTALLTEREPELRKYLETGDAVGPLTRLTFHASYSYEDFIEGYRPTDSTGGNLSLRLEDGIFKRVCRAAQANPRKPYLVLIDEINRANVAKVLGELITLLEKDKRGLLISLPQSKEPFTIPPNVFVLGTMNTADRSIKLLDAALRRRFAFVELMPDSTLLAGGKVGALILSQFLDELNRRIAAKEGREKQIGHSFLLDGTGPVSEPEEFARRFRQEILPLLQEYCYDDYGVLAEYVGGALVDQEGQMLNSEILADSDRLLAALEDEFNPEHLS